MRQTAAYFVVLVLMLEARPNYAEAPPTQSNGNVPRLDSVGDPLPPGALMRLGTVRFRYPSTVIELAVSPNDKYVATIGSEWLIVWEADSGKELWREACTDADVSLPGAAYGIRALAFSPDGVYLYAPGGRGQVIKWDAGSGKRETINVPSGELPQLVQSQLILADANARSIDVSSDGKQFALGAGDSLVVCDPAGKTLYRRENNPSQPITIDDLNGGDRLVFGGEYSYALFSPQSDFLAAVMSEAPQEVVLLNAADGAEKRRIPTTAKVVRMTFSPNGEQLVTTERDCAVRQYDVATGNLNWTQAIQPAERAESYTSAVAYSPDCKTVAVCAPIGADNAIYLLDATTGERRAKLEGHQWKPWGVAFSSDGRTLYSSGWDGVVRRWDIATAEQLPLPAGVHASGVAAASPNEPILAYEDDRGVIRFVRSDSGEELRTVSLPGISFTRAVFSNGGKLFAAGGVSDAQVHVAVWDVTSGEIAFRRDWDKGQDEHSEIDALEFSPDGEQLAATVFRQNGGHLWDLTTGDETAKLNHSQVFSLTFSPDGKTLVTAGWDSLIQLWDTESGATRSVIMASDAGDPEEDWRIYSVCYSPAGDLIATTHIGGRLVFWRADGLTPRDNKGSNSFSQQGIGFSPDGLWLATGMNGGKVAIWDSDAAEVVWQNDTHKYDAVNLQFDRGSQRLLTGASDGCCYLWGLRTQAPKGNQKPLDELWNDLSSDGKPAFDAFLALIGRPQDAVPYLAGRLQGISEVVDVERADPSLTQNQIRAKRLENEFDAEHGHNGERSLVVRRAVSVLAEIGTPEAQQVLQELAKLKPSSHLSLMATDALARCSQAPE